MEPEWWLIFGAIGMIAIVAYLVLEVMPFVDQMMGDK